MATPAAAPVAKPPAAAPANGAPPITFQSRLGAVKVGRLRKPLRIVIYGPEGVGKSTLAAAAPGVIFLDAEGGSEQVSVARYPFRDTEDGYIPRSYEELLYGIEDLTASPHDYKAAAFDTADKIESLMWKWMCKRDSVVSARNPDGKIFTSVEDYGYGKGYVVAAEEWRALLGRFDRLRERKGMDIIINAHAQIRPFKNPEGTDFDRWQLRIHDKAAGLLKEWADVVGFVTYEEGAKKVEEGKAARAKGWSTGRRLLRTARHATFDAKSRLLLDEEVEISIEDPWAPFAKAIEESYEDQLPKLMAGIDAEVERIGDAELKSKVAKAVKDAVAKKDEMALRRFVINLKTRQPKEQS